MSPTVLILLRNRSKIDTVGDIKFFCEIADGTVMLNSALREKWCIYRTVPKPASLHVKARAKKVNRNSSQCCWHSALSVTTRRSLENKPENRTRCRRQRAALSAATPNSLEMIQKTRKRCRRQRRVVVDNASSSGNSCSFLIPGVVSR